MAFWKKEDSERKKDMEKLKKQVQSTSEDRASDEKKTKLPEPPSKEKPQVSRNSKDSKKIEPKTDSSDLPEPPEKVPEEDLFEEMKEPAQPEMPQKESGAPLFVRVENYRDILGTMEEIKNMIGDLKELFSLMSSVDEVKRDGMDGLKKGISDLADALIAMDSEFVRPEDMEGDSRETSSEVSETMKDLQSELESIRGELNEL